MYAYTTAGDTRTLQLRIDAKKSEIEDLRQSILDTDRKIEKYKELAAYVKNYQAGSSCSSAYKKAKNKESFFEKNESTILIYEAADRFIRSKGLDPEKITYDHVVQGIETLTAQKETARQDYRTKTKDLKALESQMQILDTYMQQNHLAKYHEQKPKREKDGR